MGPSQERRSPQTPPGKSSASLLTISKPAVFLEVKKDSSSRQKPTREASETHRQYEQLFDTGFRSLVGALLVVFSLVYATSLVLSLVGEGDVLQIDVRHLDKLWKVEAQDLGVESAKDSDVYIKGMGLAPGLDLESLGRSEHEGPPKIAFMFLVRGPMPLTPLWERFFRNNTDRASVYIHASQEGYNVSEHVSRESMFYGGQIPGVKVVWGGFGMVRAERLLIAAALKDPANQRFVLVSESCIPIRSFQYVHDYLFAQNKSFITAHHTTWRFPGRKMTQVIPESKFRKGSQWVTLTRKHAELVSLDRKYFDLFEETHARIPDESYIQTVVPLLDPEGVEPRSVSFTEWACRFAWHPRTFRRWRVSEKLVKGIQERHMPTREVVTLLWSMSQSQPCTLGGEPAPCFLFARKFHAETLPQLLKFGDLLGY